MKVSQAETTHIIKCPMWPIVSVHVKAGWNIIGTTSKKVLTDTIMTEPAGILTTGFYDFISDGGYVEADTLIPGKAYWVKANSVGEVYLTSLPSGIDPQPWPAYYREPSWHPGGEWIAAEHEDSIDVNEDSVYDDWFSGIWIINASTGDKLPLIRNAWFPEWNPDGTKLLYTNRADRHLYTVSITNLDSASIDSNSITQITYNGNNYEPAWSPDGSTIVYKLHGPVEYGKITVINSDGTNERRITGGDDPSWSLDSKHLLFIGLWRDIYKISIPDSQVTRLTFFNDDGAYITDNYSPKYNSTNELIYFRSDPPTIEPDAILMMDSAGSMMQKISPDLALDFDISPDGDNIVFLFWDDLCPHAGSGHLWLMNADGTNLRQLTH
ncbi:MAG: hypothetical protein EPO24_11675 [Bacteroidetes bacterium]|nr:MAG: hypothetical protein EPO24_11675 [Bacteroidota bacterium]